MTNKLQALHKSTKTLGHASGLRQYTDGDAQETAGIEVLGISFNSACMSQGCWEIDLKYNLVHKTLSVTSSRNEPPATFCSSIAHAHATPMHACIVMHSEFLVFQSVTVEANHDN